MLGVAEIWGVPESWVYTLLNVKKNETKETSLIKIPQLEEHKENFRVILYNFCAR